MAFRKVRRGGFSTLGIRQLNIALKSYLHYPIIYLCIWKEQFLNFGLYKHIKYLMEEDIIYIRNESYTGPCSTISDHLQ